MKQKNPYRSLLQPGIRGKVVTRDYKSITILNRQDISIRLLTGELLPGVWDFGYIIQKKDIPDSQKLPGEGEGWFRSERDATLYGLAQIRMMYTLGSIEISHIDLQISKINSVSLFD